MRSFLHCLLLLIISNLIPYAAPQLHAEAYETTATNQQNTLVPLPKSCGGGLPPGASVPACCLFGYVFIDGQTVSGAKITITNARGQVEDWTGEGPDSTLPYYRLSLSDAPLAVQIGEIITIKAEYSGYQRIINHTILPGAQQVDIVLPRFQAEGYVYDSQIWKQSSPGLFDTPYGGIAIDGSDTIYVSDTRNARVQKFTNGGQFLRQWGSLGHQPGQFEITVGIAADSLGNIFVVDRNNHRVQKFSNTGTWIKSWGEYGSANGQFKYPGGIGLDTAGNIYITDLLNNRIQKFTNNGLWLDSWGDQGSGPGQFNGPEGIAIDRDGLIYVADAQNHRIQRRSIVGVWSIIGTQGSAVGQFEAPIGISVDAAGNLYVADTGNNRVQKFNSSGMPILSIDSAGFAPGQLLAPTAIALDSTGNLYIADTDNHRVQKFNQSGQFLALIGGFEETPGRVGSPGDIATDSNNVMYVVDTRFQRIQTFNQNGSLRSYWSSNAAGGFREPQGIAVSPAGTFIYVADTGNNRILKLNSAGELVANWNSIDGAGLLNAPAGVALTADSSTIYVADTGNNRILKLDGNGNLLASWNNAGTAGAFAVPEGVAVDQSGTNVYIVDTGKHRIVQTTNTGALVRTWGSQGNGIGQFFNPIHAHVDTAGNLLVADRSNHRIQKFSSTGIALFVSPDTSLLNGPSGGAIDGQGRIIVADTDNDRLAILRRMTYTRPIATLVAVSARSVVQGQSVQFYGMGSDSDETPALAALEWFLDTASTPFATGGTISLSTSSLTPGRHTISLRARDTEGELSDLVATTIDVSPSTLPTTAKRWTFLLYLDGDSPNLAASLNRTSPLGALYRLERAAPNVQVTVAALYDGPLSGGGDSFRYLIRPDGTFSQESLGEVNMGDPQTLIDFARWGLAQAPADYTYLTLADHATALDGIAWDFTTDRNERLTPGEIRTAMVGITDSGTRPIDVLHFDGCLMGLLEPAYQMRGLARYLVASKNLGWSAFAYEQYRALVNQQTDPRTLAIGITDSYAQVVGAGGYPYTISAFDLGQVDAAARATDQLAGELLRYALASTTNRTQLNTLRTQVQKLDSGGNFFLSDEDEYVDLDHWAELVATGISDSAIQTSATALRSSLTRLVLRNYATSGVLDTVVGVPGAGYDLRNARGVGIYYPPRPSVRTYQVYVQGELNFVNDQRWDEYLAAGLAPLPFDDTLPEPHPIQPIILPVIPPQGTLPYHVFLPIVLN